MKAYAVGTGAVVVAVVVVEAIAGAMAIVARSSTLLCCWLKLQM